MYGQATNLKGNAISAVLLFVEIKSVCYFVAVCIVHGCGSVFADLSLRLFF